MAGPLVVVRKPNGRRPDLVRSSLDPDHLRPLGDSLGSGGAVGLDGLVGLDHLQQLQHRLVVLVLVGEQHLVGEAVRQQLVVGVEFDLVQDLQRALSDLLHVWADLVGPQDRQLAPDLAGLLDRVVEIAEVAAERFAAADPLNEPELLEVADVAEVPDQRAEDRVVDPIELLLGERLDQLEGVAAGLIQTPGQFGLPVGSGTRSTGGRGCSNLGDRSRLAGRGGRLGARDPPPTAPADSRPFK